MSLKDLALAGAEDANQAWPVWQRFWQELNTINPSSSAGRARPPPLLIVVDGFDHWMGITKYRSAEFNLIHAHQLTLIEQFVSLLFPSASPSPPSSHPSSSNLANGGIVLAATTGSNTPNFSSFNRLLTQLQARARGLEITDPDFPMPGPYTRVDDRVVGLLGATSRTTQPDVRTLKGLSRLEARGLLEYFARSGVMKDVVTEKLVSEKYALSSGGVVGEIARFGTRLRV